jgi:hypothetical protein
VELTVTFLKSTIEAPVRAPPRSSVIAPPHLRRDVCAAWAPPEIPPVDPGRRAILAVAQA